MKLHGIVSGRSAGVNRFALRLTEPGHRPDASWAKGIMTGLTQAHGPASSWDNEHPGVTGIGIVAGIPLAIVGGQDVPVGATASARSWVGAAAARGWQWRF
jgi:hypothetical protein